MIMQKFHIIFAMLVILALVSPMLAAIYIASNMKKTDNPQKTMKKLYAINLLIGK